MNLPRFSPGCFVAACGLMLALLPNANAAVSYSIAGSTYSQDFNSLVNTPENTSLQAVAAWTDDTSTPGANQQSITHNI